MARLPAARRFTLIPGPLDQSTSPTIRPAIAALVQDNLALDQTAITLPEDKGPDSQVMIKGDRAELHEILDSDGELDVFDMGIDESEVEISGSFDRRAALAQAGIIEIPYADNDIEISLVEPPPVPFTAKIERLKITDDELVEFDPLDDHAPFELLTPTIEDLSRDESRLLQKAEQLARGIKANPSTTFAQVSEASRLFTRRGKDLFWQVLRTALAYPPVLPDETSAMVVVKHAQIIEHTALEVLAYERKTKSFSLEALEIGFHSLPPYRDQPTRLAMNRALREKVAELRPIADTVTKTILQAVETGTSHFDTLQKLALQFPTERAIVWKFHALLRKQSPRPQAGEDITHVYRDQVKMIAGRIVQETLPRATIYYPALEIGYQLLPTTGNPQDEIKLRKALLQKVKDELVLVGLKKPAQELVHKFKNAPFAKNQLTSEAIAALPASQQSLFPEAVKRALAPEIAKARRELTERSTIAQILIDGAPQRKAKIVDRLAEGLSPLEQIMLRENTGSSVLSNRLFGDYERLGLIPPNPQTKLPPIPSVTAPVAEVIEDCTELVEPGIWQRFTTGLKNGINRVSNWWGDVKKSWQEFSFMNFLNSHRRVVTLTTAVAALNAREAYLNYTTEIAPMAQSSTNDQPNKPDIIQVQEAAFSMPMGTSASGTRNTLNYIPVGLGKRDHFWHNHGAFTPQHLRLATGDQVRFITPGYQQVSLITQTAIVTHPWELRVDQHDAMANVFNVLEAYMSTRSFELAYPNYRPGDRDQTTLFDALARYAPRAHHILHRIAHGDVINLGIDIEGNIVITSWINAQGINMLAGEPAISIRMNSLSNLGEFSRSETALARLTPPLPEGTSDHHRLALLQ